MVQGEVHAKFGSDPSSSLGGEWQQTDRQTDRQTHLSVLYIWIRKKSAKKGLGCYSQRIYRMHAQNVLVKFCTDSLKTGLAAMWTVAVAAPARLRLPSPRSQETFTCLRHSSITRHHVNWHIKLGNGLYCCHVLKKQALFFFLLLSSVDIVVNDVSVATTWIVAATAPARLRSPPPHSQVTLMCLRHLSRTRHHVNTHIKLGSCLDFCQIKQKSWLFFVLLLAFLLVGLAVVGLVLVFFAVVSLFCWY